MENFAAGIIPYILINGERYFLLGLEISNNKWSGFVGKSEQGETITQTAIREFNEETVGIFQSYDIYLNVKINETKCLTDKTSTDKNVYIYFIEFPEESQEVIKDFINVKATMVLDHYHEKSIIKWFNLKDIKNSNRILYRLKQMIVTNF